MDVASGHQVLDTLPISVDGTFASSALVALAEGANTIVVALDGAERVAESSYSVTFDPTSPTIEVVRPKAGGTVEGPDVFVEDRTEPGAEVIVNGRPPQPTPDGSFTDRLTPPPGAMRIEISAKDKAGNETKTQLTVL